MARSKHIVMLAGLAAGGAGAAQAGMSEGAYECWFFSQPQPSLNITVTGATSYTAAADGSDGEYALSGSDVTWVSGLMKGSMPDGFTTLYEVRHGVPTIAFISARGAEAAFCEHAAAGR